MIKKFLCLCVVLILTQSKLYASNEQSNFICLKNSTCWIPIFLVDSTSNDGISGVTPSSIYYDIDNGVNTSIGLITNNCSTGNWCEKNSSLQTGKYLFKFTDTSITGFVSGVVNAIGVYRAPFAFRIVEDIATVAQPVSGNVTLVADQAVNVTKIAGATVSTTTAQIGTNVVSTSTNVITASSIADGAITPTKEYVASGTVSAISTTTTIYTTALAVINERKYNNMCLYSASNGERSRILSTGNGFFKVRGFSVAPTNGSNLIVYADGCL